MQWLHPPIAPVCTSFARFTVVMHMPIPVPRAVRVQVITSDSTKVVTKARTGLSQLDLGANLVAVGRTGRHGVATAGAVGVLITGVYGPGKSPVAAEIAYLLGQQGWPCALPGLDYLGWAGTGGSQISQRPYLDCL